jgi:glycosyltransferase involved in cell wall biosynthesis
MSLLPPSGSDAMKFVLVQTAVGDYRREFLNIVQARMGQDFQLLVGEKYFDGTTITRVDLGANQFRIDNHYWLGRRVSFQTGHFAKVLRAQRAMLELNPRILSNWVIILGRRLLGRKTGLWGHAWPRKGRNQGGTRLRDIMICLAGNVVAYTPRDAADFRQRLPRNVGVYCAPNALYPEAEIYDRAVGQPFRFLFIGRLVEAKKPELVLRAFARVAAKMSGSRLSIVGAGPLDESLKSLAGQLGVLEQTEFLGHVSDKSRLSYLFGEAAACLSPGYVGLSAIQSFSFGTPMLIADNELHAPEIAAITAGENALFFKSDDEVDFSRIMQTIWDQREAWQAKRPLIANFCRENYSAERMAGGFMEFFYD